MNVIKLNYMRYLCRQLSASSSLFSYKSAISLENIYPRSSLKLTTPTEVCIFKFCCLALNHEGKCNNGIRIMMKIAQKQWCVTKIIGPRVW